MSYAGYVPGNLYLQFMAFYKGSPETVFMCFCFHKWLERILGFEYVFFVLNSFRASQELAELVQFVFGLNLNTQLVFYWYFRSLLLWASCKEVEIWNFLFHFKLAFVHSFNKHFLIIPRVLAHYEKWTICTCFYK